MKMKNLLMAIVIAVFGVAVSNAAFATPNASILYEETNVAEGLWRYDYTFNNTSTAGEYLYKVFLDFSQPVSATGSALPSGWFGTVWTGTHNTLYLDAMSIDPANDIASGNSKSGFSFTANSQVGNTLFYAEFDDHKGGFSRSSGTTDQIPVAPEPVSSLLFVIGGATLGGRILARRKK